jgi:hypothetical protein
MNHLEGTKTVVGSAATASNASAVLRLDTLGYDYASFDVVYAATNEAGTTSPASQVLTLKQSDAATTGYDVITGYPTVAAPTANASSNVATVVRLDVDMRGKKRYLEVSASPSTSSPVVVVARLGKGEQHPVNAAGKGVGAAFSG